MDWVSLGGALILAIVAALIVAIVLAIFKLRARRAGPFSGNWKSRFDSADGCKNTEQITLRSFLGVVWGTSTCQWEEGGINKTEQYKIRGLYRGPVLVAAYLATKRHSYDMGVFIIRLLPEGTKGEGKITSYESPTGKTSFDWNDLNHFDYVWDKP